MIAFNNLSIELGTNTKLAIHSNFEVRIFSIISKMKTKYILIASNSIIMNIGTKYEQSGMVTGNRVVLLDE